jgi:hypothetical protein
MVPLENSSRGETETLRAFVRAERRYGWIAYGLRVHWRGQVIGAEGWVGGTQKVYAQMLALDALLAAIEIADIEPKVEMIMHREHLRQRLDQRHTRKVAAQIGEPMKPSREDPERWTDVQIRYEAFGVKIRMAMSEVEKQELNSVFLTLDDLLAEKLRSYGGPPVEPNLSLEF